jgi:hypothetical protein
MSKFSGAFHLVQHSQNSQDIEIFDSKGTKIDAAIISVNVKAVVGEMVEVEIVGFVNVWGSLEEMNRGIEDIYLEKTAKDKFSKQVRV